jgi:hypothetical protein
MYASSLFSEAGRFRLSHRSRGFAPFRALAWLVLLFSALPGFAQTYTGALSITQPTFLAIDTDASGTKWLYVSQHGEVRGDGSVPTNGGPIVKFNLTTGSTTGIPLTTHGTGDGQFISPDGMVIDPATHDLIVSDRYLSRIQRLHNDGTFVLKWGTPTAGQPNEMHGPCGLAIDSAGAIYVAEHGDTVNQPFGAGGQHVSKYTLSNSSSTATVAQVFRIGSRGLGDGEFNYTGPYGIAVNGSTFYVCDAFSSRVQVFGLNGSYQSQFSLPGALPVGIFADSSGMLWISEATNTPGAGTSSGSIQQVERRTTAGATTGMVFGSPGSGAGQFDLPFGVAIDAAAHKAYVSDYNNNRVQIFDVGTSGGGGGGGSVPVVSNATVTGNIGTAITSAQVGATNSATSFSAPGLALYGLSINAAGQITGTPTVTATNVPISVTAANSSGTSAAATILLNIAPSGWARPTAGPSVTSFTFIAHTLTFEIAFDEPVTGVDVSDFTFFASQFVQGGSLASVNQIDASHYRLNITYSGGAPGSMSITIKSSGTGIVGANSHFEYSGGGITKAVVPITPHLETDPPIVAFFHPDTVMGNTVNFLVGFNKNTWNIQPSNVTINKTGSVVATLGNIMPSDDTATEFVIPVTYSGTGTISLTLSNATQQTITDGNYNVYVGPNTSEVYTTPAAVPVLSNVVVSGTVGSAIAPVQVYATGLPATFSATGLAAYGLSISASGQITGTPTATASTTVNVTATNSTGTSAPATITLNLVTAGGGGGGSVPVVSNASVTGTVGTAITPVQVSATNAPTSFSASGLATYGLSISSSGLITGTPTTTATNAAVSVTASNASGTSAAATITLNISAASGGGGSAPVVSNASVSGTVGTAITPVQVSATNSPTNFSASGLASYGLAISSTGRITGTPSAVASNVAVSVTASNASGTSAPATITLNIGAATPPPPPPPPPPPGLKSQTVVFVPPVSSLFVGDSLQLSGTASSGLPVTYQLITGDATLSGNTLIINSTSAVVIRATQSGDSTWAAASTDATFNAIKHAQSISIPSVPSAVHTDSAFTLSATASSGLPITYSVVSGPATVSGNSLTFTGTGTVVVRATQSGNGLYDATDSTMTITANPVPRLINISSRLNVSSNDANGASIAGFVVTGTTAKQMLIRAVGPSLTRFGVSGPLANPTLTLRDTTGAVVATNSGWANDAQIAAAAAGVGAFDLTSGSKDAAVLVSLQPGPYTATVQSATNGGPVLIEVYDVSATAAVPTKQLINISTRGTVGTGDNVLVGGFVVSGNEPKKVLIRGVGPALAQFKVGGVLSDPVLKVYSNTSVVIAQNDNWGTASPVSTETVATAAQISAAATATGAFPFDAGSSDAAVLLTLQPGQYSAIVTGASNSTGAAMIEIYEVPTP